MKTDVDPIVRMGNYNPPAGFSKIDGPVLCRCLRLFRHADGSNWCCAKNGYVPGAFPAEQQPQQANPNVVDLVTAPEQAAALKEKLEHALHDVCAVLDQIDAASLHGSFQLGKGQYWNVASMTVAKHF